MKRNRGGQPILICTRCGCNRTPIMNLRVDRTKFECKPCDAEYMRLWKQKNAEHVTEYRHKHWETFPEKRAAGDRRRYERWFAKNPEHVRKLQVQRTNRRRVCKLNAEGSHTLAEFEIVCEQQNQCCFDCGVKRKLEQGHLIPLSVGGPDYISNIVGQCRTCNAKQHDKIHPSVILAK